jgi:hypothetical protein
MTKSESISNLAKALSCFQSKVAIIRKTANNPFFKSKYAPLPEILEAITTPLHECGLTFSQMPDGESLTTILIHCESGEFLQSSYPLHPIKNDPQAFGSAITYARRYAISAILCLNVDDDDDGNKATYPNGYNKPSTQTVAPNIPNVTTADQLQEKEWLNPKTENWTKAVDYLARGNAMHKIEAKYRISTKNKELLQDEVMEAINTKLLTK